MLQFEKIEREGCWHIGAKLPAGFVHLNCYPSSLLCFCTPDWKQAVCAERTLSETISRISRDMYETHDFHCPHYKGPWLLRQARGDSVYKNLLPTNTSLFEGYMLGDPIPDFSELHAEAGFH